MAAGGPFHGLFLTAELSTRLARHGHRTGDASDADAVVALAQEQYDLGTMDWFKVDASGRRRRNTLRRVKAGARGMTTIAMRPATRCSATPPLAAR